MLVKDSKTIAPLKNIMDNLSKKYHCTIFATVNSIEEIDEKLLRNGRFDLKIGLPPANKKMPKHY